MFAVTCPTYDAPVLIWTSSIRRLTSTARGIAVDFTCACGAPAATMAGRDAVAHGIVCHGEPARSSTSRRHPIAAGAGDAS